MIVRRGDTCPNHNWVKAGEDGCRHCRGFCGLFDEGIDCCYSEVPNREPKYRVGDMKYFHEYHNVISYSRIRKLTWDGFGWNYTFARKQHPTRECYVYDTRVEGEESELREKAEALYDELISFKERYGRLPVIEKLMIERK